MTELTVKQALSLAPFARTRVVAGHSGLDRVIRSVNVMEVPDIADFVRPKELLLTTGFPLRDNPDALCSLIPILVAHDVAALAIKLNRYVHEIPAEMMAAADASGIPILELPPDASFNEYMNPLLGEILNRQAVMLRRSQEVHATFTRVLLEGGGFTEICRALADFTGREVALYDRERPIAVTTPHPLGVLPRVQQVSRWHEEALEVLGLGHLLHAEPVLVGWGVCGQVVLWGERSLNEIDRLAVQHATTVLGLEFQRQESIRETERRYTNEFLTEFLQGRLGSLSEVKRRAETLSLPLEATDAHMTIYVGGADLPVEPGWRKRLGGHIGVMRRLYGIIDTICRSEEVTYIIFEQEGDLQLLLQPADRANRPKVYKQLDRIARRLVGAVQEALPELKLVIGIGRYYGDLMRLPESYLESRRAVSVGRKTGETVIHYDKLGVYRLLVTSSQAELDLFVQDLLGPLLEYDREHTAELIRTLESYLDHGRSVKLTAEALFVHYNTVRYRIDRIEQLLGRSLEDPEYQLSLHVGLKACSMLRSD